MHHEIEKFTHTTTTTMNTIKFHADGCFRDSEDSDSNHSTTPPPSSTDSTHESNLQSFYSGEVNKIARNYKRSTQ